MDTIAFAELGIVSETPSRTNTEHTTEDRDTGNVVQLASATPTEDQSGDDQPLDHFITEDGMTFAGRHLIVDLWGAEKLDDIAHIEETLKEAVEVAGATLLHIHLHRFSPTGVSGVAVLAESHISIHTWPEKGYAALDIFMCGDAVPSRAIPVLKRAFTPDQVQLGDFKRGMSG